MEIQGANDGREPVDGVRPVPTTGWWVPVATGVLVAAGALLPLVSAGGDGTRYASGFELTAVLTVAALSVLGGGVARFSPLGMALAAGAGLTFLGIAATGARAGEAVIQAGDRLEVEVVWGVGAYAWSVAVVGCLAVIALGIRTLVPPRAPVWPVVTAAAGIAVFAAGLILPPRGFAMGENLFAGDPWADAAIVTLLAGLPVVVVVVVCSRTRAAVVFGAGAMAPWVTSWLVFATYGTPGGLPIPWPDVPRVGSTAIVLTCGLGSLWWSAASSATASRADVALSSTSRTVTSVVTAATAIAVIGGGLAIDTADYGFAASLAGPSYAEVFGAVPLEPVEG